MTVAPSPFTMFIRLSRPYNALLPAIAIVAGYVIGHGSSPWRLVATIVGFVLLHGVVTVWNDITDEAGDTHNGITRMQVVRRAGYYQRYIHWLQAITGLVLLGSLALAPALTLLLALYLFLGWLYNATPRLSERPISSMVVMLFAYGCVPFALGMLLGSVRWQAVILGVAWSLSRLSLSLLKDYKDAHGDAQAHKKTFLLVYGNSITAYASLALLVAGVSGIIWIAALHRAGAGVAVLAALAVWLIAERSQLLTRHTYRELHLVFTDCLRYQIVFDVAVVAWLIS